MMGRITGEAACGSAFSGWKVLVVSYTAVYENSGSHFVLNRDRMGSIHLER